MPDFKDVEFPADVAEATTSFWEVLTVGESDELDRDLTPDSDSNSLGIFRLRSRKLTNIQFKWKEFIFNVLPISTGAFVTFTQNAILGCLLGMRAIYIGASLRDIVLDNHTSNIALRIHELSWNAESNSYGFVSINKVKAACSDVEDFDNKLVSLFSLGIAGLDARGNEVIMYEKVILSS